MFMGSALEKMTMNVLLTDYIFLYMNDRTNILYDLKHGFLKRSIESQLLAFTQDVLNKVRSGKQTDVIIMDFPKTFDNVSHWRLAIKMRNYGITGPVNKWRVNFLAQRSQRVVCKVNIPTGPQSSVVYRKALSLVLYYSNIHKCSPIQGGCYRPSLRR